MNTNESRRKLIEIFAAVVGAVVAKHFEMHREWRRVSKKEINNAPQNSNTKMGKCSVCFFYLSLVVFTFIYAFWWQYKKRQNNHLDTVHSWESVSRVFWPDFLKRIPYRAPLSVIPHSPIRLSFYISNAILICARFFPLTIPIKSVDCLFFLFSQKKNCFISRCRWYQSFSCLLVSCIQHLPSLASG